MQSLAGGMLPGVQLAAAAAFVALALVSIRSTARGGVAGSGWAAAAFGSMATVLVTIPALEAWNVESTVVAGLLGLLLLAFPYLLMRFTGSLRPLPRWVNGLAAVAAVGVMSASLVVPAVQDRLPAGVIGGYLLAIILYWVLVSSITVVRLWRAGRGQPALACRRMRLMSCAAAVLSAGICLVTLAVGAYADVVALGIHLLVLLSAGAFALGLYPPSGIRLWWAGPEYARLHAAMMSMMQAKTADEVARELLPPTIRIVGGSGAALVGPDGVVTASYGDAPPTGSALAPAYETAGEAAETARETLSLGAGQGHLVVWTSVYTPLFGREEIGILHAMAGVAAVSLERAALLIEEEDRRKVLEEAQRRADAAREEATRANVAKTEFLSRMSHELRTPLNAILGFGQLLDASAGLSEEDRESVRYVLKGGRHLLDLINEVLDLSRIEAGKMSISLEPVRVSDLIQDTVALIRPMVAERSIGLATELGGDYDFVRTDRQRCSQVLLNLLSNAVKYNYDGGSVAVSCRRSGEDWVRIAVTDTGPGIDPSRQDKLFEPFERLGADTSGVEGSGLGLALTKQLVEVMGGTIGVESVPGQGSTFWVQLPVTDPPERTAVSAGKQDRHEQPDADRTLLLVEDNLANLRLVTAMLRRRPGISVIPAVQGRLAIELAHLHDPALIVLDLHLPDLTGQEVLHRLKADPRTRHIPVVVASADATPGRVRQLREAGAFDYLTKPLDLQPFLDTVDRALARES